MHQPSENLNGYWSILGRGFFDNYLRKGLNLEEQN